MCNKRRNCYRVILIILTRRVKRQIGKELVRKMNKRRNYEYIIIVPEDVIIFET